MKNQNILSQTDIVKRDEFLESVKAKRKPLSDDHKKSISESHQGKKRSLEHRMNIKQGLRGRKLSTNHRKSLSKSSKGRKNNEIQNEALFLHKKNTVVFSLEMKIQTGESQVLSEKELEGVNRPHYEKVKRILKNK